jgi:SAM-dependent methyltransferase
MKKLDKFGLCLEEYTNNKNNAQIYYNRAIGKSPEMEVSKALAKIVKKIIKKDHKVLDVGCACGHYYRSLRREIKNNFFYTGVDPYKIFLDKAKLAWKNDLNVNFKNGNKRDWKQDNLEFLCYNCYYLTIGDIFTPKQMQGIEDTYEIPKRQEVKWEMDDAMYEQFKSLNLLDENDDKDDDDDFISYND